MTTLPLSPKTIDEMVSSTIKSSAVFQLARTRQVAAGRDHVIYGYDPATARWHQPTDTSASKVEDNLAIREIDIKMAEQYSATSFPDYQAEDAEFMLAEVKANLPLALGASFDTSFFGPTQGLAGSPMPGFTGRTIEVDGTPESWTAAVDEVESLGHTPTAWLLDNAAKALIRTSLTSGTVYNSANIAVNDGIAIAGHPALFRNLKLADPDLLGVVGDWDAAIALYTKSISLELYGKTSSYDQRLRNKTSIYGGQRRGGAVLNQDSFVRIVRTTV
jgi:hypothetical protein